MPVSPEDVRAAASGLAGVTERPHFGNTAFRRRTQFATLLPAALNLLVDESEARALVAERSDVTILMWGKNVAGVRTQLADLDRASLTELLTVAWQQHD